MSAQELIYLVEDDADIARLVSLELERYGYRVRYFRTGAQLLAALNQMPRVCIVDLGLPDMDGLELVRQLTAQANIGVMILSGRDSLPDRVLGLELGADDYISKPFDPRELVARVSSVIRRLDKNSQPKSTIYSPGEKGRSIARFEHWCFDSATLTLTRDSGEEAVLSAGEAELLLQLLQSPKQILSRDQLLRQQDDAFDRSIDVRMSRIRKKLEENPKSPRLIKTVYGMGYMLATDVRWE
ncbi:response regulator transcription factor [Parathalassolituus penaei]|uniref:Response regulator transcription factor n=1 Tax=Parathalassolituus penaei TaxID=2997323 RepID=A0A9X3ED23_9GAMM|nr:response regulator transcription factor [Parathalassolituus penaei]MCY0964420.1 response regulator transcription factor [Parathalassolituus penaei]